MKRSRLIQIISIVGVALVALAAFLASGHSTARATQRAAVKTANLTLGRLVVDGRGRTLYLFEKDTRGRSTCSGACAANWPPLLTQGKPTAGPGVKASLLGVTRRPGGTKQVTLAGHPLYRYSGDTARGQANGQDLSAFGASWYVVSPAGKKIEGDKG